MSNDSAFKSAPGSLFTLNLGDRRPKGSETGTPVKNTSVFSFDSFISQKSSSNITEDSTDVEVEPSNSSTTFNFNASSKLLSKGSVSPSKRLFSATDSATEDDPLHNKSDESSPTVSDPPAKKLCVIPKQTPAIGSKIPEDSKTTGLTIQKRSFSFSARSPTAISSVSLNKERPAVREGNTLVSTAKNSAIRNVTAKSFSSFPSTPKLVGSNSSQKKVPVVPEPPPTPSTMEETELAAIEESSSSFQEFCVERTQQTQKKLEELNFQLLENSEKLKELSVRLYLLNNEVLFMNSPTLMDELEKISASLRLVEE